MLSVTTRYRDAIYFGRGHFLAGNHPNLRRTDAFFKRDCRTTAIGMVVTGQRDCRITVMQQAAAMNDTQRSLLDYLRTFEVSILPADVHIALIEYRTIALLSQFLRMDKMCFTCAHIRHVRRETRHAVISLTALTVGIADLLQAVLGDLDEVNMLVTLKLRPVVFAIPSYDVDMVRGNAQPTAVTRPEADLVKWDAHRAWFPVLPRPAACVLKIMWTLHGLG